MAGIVEIQVCKTCLENGYINRVPGKSPVNDFEPSTTYCGRCGEFLLRNYNAQIKFK